MKQLKVKSKLSATELNGGKIGLWTSMEGKFESRHFERFGTEAFRLSKSLFSAVLPVFWPNFA